MDLNASLSIAASGIAAVNAQLAVTSQNVGNASTPGYATETVAQSDLTGGGYGFGVVTGPAVLTTDPQLQSSVLSQGADVAGQQVTSGALASLDALQGTTGAGNDLASQVGALSNAFTVLGSNPANESQQVAVVQAATTLANGIQGQAAGYASAQQGAQNSLVSEVATLNAAVQSIGVLSEKIVAAHATGTSTADLQVQLNVQEQAASQLSGLQFLPQQNGGVIAIQGGSQVDLTGPSPGPFSLAPATLSSGGDAAAIAAVGAGRDEPGHDGHDRRAVDLAGHYDPDLASWAGPVCRHVGEPVFQPGSGAVYRSARQCPRRGRDHAPGLYRLFQHH